MATENETIADIIAWLRKPREGENAYLTLWRDEIADRLEAALKRERGDCAKLREVVDAMMYEAFALCDSCVKPAAERGKLLAKWCNKLCAALAAPPRNCDVGTVKDQFARFRKFCKKDSMDSFAATAYCAHECPCGNSYDCKLAWAQMPYEGGVK